MPAQRSSRPRPPGPLLDPNPEVGFIPSAELHAWARSTFIDDEASLFNPEHMHLQQADIGFLWTSVGNGRHGKTIVGQCEPGEPRGFGKWAGARVTQQLEEWFGVVPDFLITLSAPYAAQCGDAEFCALVEHELLHAGQERDPFGAPKFRKTGRPAFAMRGHDCEEFTSVVSRYGVVSESVRALVEAANRAPQIAQVSISQACGTCRLKLVA